ncbi:MAG: DUF58 domain-containing protein [Pirellulales bacterium]|nr:DUF58 domain-containing protein [Pirellulales bacterium]
MHLTNSQLDPQTLAQLQGLELRARYIVDGYLSGMHRSAHHGQSVEFTEHREYSPGDDLRYVDWKVFGKTDKVYLKQFEAETNLVCYLLVDISESMRYQSETAPLSKLEYARCLAAALGMIVLRQRDSVSLVTFDEQVCELVRESGNPAQLRQLVEVMQRALAERKSRLGKVLHEVSQRVRRRGVVVVLSDLLGDTESFLSGLKHLRHQRHEVIALHLLDPAELEFPFRRTTLFEGLEALPEVLAEPRGVRRAYLEVLAEFLERVQVGCRSMQVDYELLRTDESFDLALQRVLTKRKIRR